MARRKLGDVNVDAVVVAAGRGERFGSSEKLLADVGGRPVLAWSLSALAAAPSVGRIVLVARNDDVARVAATAAGLAGDARLRVVRGGPRRRDSVAAGLAACTTEYVLIHDGARPFVTVELIEACIAAAAGRPGAIAAVPVTDTIKVVGEDGTIAEHPDRRHLWAAQTPQVVRRELWLAAAMADDADATDDAAMLARLGHRCRVVEGDRSNIKVTYPIDVAIARAIAAWRREAETP